VTTGEKKFLPTTSVEKLFGGNPEVTPISPEVRGGGRKDDSWRRRKNREVSMLLSFLLFVNDEDADAK
jgi:hypothetical protein